MTQVARRTVASELQYIIDKPDRAAAMLARIAASGRLDAKSPAKPFGDRGEVLIQMWVFPEPEQPARKLSTRTKAIAAGTGAAGTVVGLSGWALYEIVAAYYAYIFGGIVVLLLIAAGVWVFRPRDCEIIHIRR